MRRIISLSVILLLILAPPAILPTTARAATVTANVFTDPAASACSTTGVPPCSLRDAITFANANPGTTLQLLTGTYTLTVGQLAVTANITLTGAGASSTIIDGNRGTRIFDISSGATMAINGMTLQHGSATTTGGGIRNAGSLSLANVTLAANLAVGTDRTLPGGPASGGGIANLGGSVTCTTCTFDHNLVIGGRGADTTGPDAPGGMPQGVRLTAMAAASR